MPNVNRNNTVTVHFFSYVSYPAWRFVYRLFLILGLLVLASCFEPAEQSPNKDSRLLGMQKSTQTASCNTTITAEVVALEQIITFNRFGAFNPAGMVYALRQDLVYDDPTTDKEEQLPLPEASKLNDTVFAKSIAGRVSLKSDKRPRPLVLRVHEDECLEVKFWNLLSPLPTVHTTYARADFPKGGVQRHAVQSEIPKGVSLTDLSTPPRNVSEQADPQHPLFPLPAQEEPDYPTTRSASIHVNGLDYVNIDADGANVGKNNSSLAEPGTSKTYTWYARQEGGYFFYSAGALAGGEGDGGQLGLGLFGSVNVEPKGSIWYRSQVTHNDITGAKSSKSTHYDDLNYAKLAILDGNQIIHSDLNAVIYQPNGNPNKDGDLKESGMSCSEKSPGVSCGMSFREFTTIFHDENKVFQAFAELADENNPISAIGDGMAINYGSSGVGSAVLANKNHIGPAKACKDCKLEEFFLSSWANGDPAMVVKRDINGKEIEALYPDDPSNVHHAYLGDPVRFRNIHAGPKETHVFHLHAHQWLQDKNDPNSNYLDSQTISPGSSYTYDINYGGGGNRNLTVGDAIFHCHLYPHFAAGMWELWRNHDVFEDGKLGYFDKELPVSATNDPTMRSLPDHEIAQGTPNPAIVPIPGYALAPLPTADFRGYPFYIAGDKGHRPPQPPLDMARDEQDPSKELNGGLPRHIITDGELYAEMQPETLFTEFGDPKATKAARYIAKRTWTLNKDHNNIGMAAKLKYATIKVLPQCGTKDELLAMAFHAGWTKTQIEQMKTGALPKDMPAWCQKDVMTVLEGIDTSNWSFNTEDDKTWPNRKYKKAGGDGKLLENMRPLWEAHGYKSGKNKANITAYNAGDLFRVNGYSPAQGAPFADPCPSQYHTKEGDVHVNRDHPRLYKTAYIQFDMTVNKYGWHDPQARMPVLEEDAAPTFSGDRLAEPLFFRANSGDCIQFQATNLIPSVLNLDDFQVYTPTDTIGQHIHLVKFDVTSSDGSANGWNYEDGTFAADEVRERIEASDPKKGGNIVDWQDNPVAKGFTLNAETHPMFKKGGSMAASHATDAKRLTTLGVCNNKGGAKENPWCGAQTTVQRWWADPVLNDKWDDRTMRAVFTHDHYGPSSHQQHGFYGALIVEPRDTVWTKLAASPADVDQSKPTCDATTLSGSAAKPCRADGGPTSYAANIGFPKDYPPEKLAEHKGEIRREYNLAFADFAILYNADLRPVNPPSRQDELMLPHNVRDGLKPKPEGISTEDPGTRLLNYRNEPIPLRIAEEDHSDNEKDKPSSLEYHQKTTLGNGKGKVKTEGDMANVFSSVVHKGSEFDLGKANLSASVLEQKATHFANRRFEKLNNNVPHEIIDATNLQAILKQTEKDRLKFVQHLYESEPWRDVNGGDPSTPVLAAYEGDPLQLHLIQGAHEEQHVFSMNGMKWLAQPKVLNSGYMNGQQIGISEHFEFNIEIPNPRAVTTDYLISSPSVENYWDGMWGLMRSHGWKANGTRIAPNDIPNLARLPGIPTIHSPQSDAGRICTVDAYNHAQERYVSAWLASDILAKRGAGMNKLTYNSRFSITDLNAIVFVELPPDWIKGDIINWPKADDLLSRFQDMYGLHPVQDNNDKPMPVKELEPLILRAAAGRCVKVYFKSYLPENFDDGANASNPNSWSYNLMPPIVSGFNFNQVQMSSTVGLTPQLLAYDIQGNEGARIGRNGSDLNKEQGEDESLPSVSVGCRKTKPDGSADLSSCNTKSPILPIEYVWYAGDRKVIPPNETGLNCEGSSSDQQAGKACHTPIEFGIAGLKDFGDVIKHSSHGGIGAIVVEPEKSNWSTVANSALDQRCLAASTLKDGKARWPMDWCRSNASANVCINANSNNPCDLGKDKHQSFREFVLLVQDDLSLQQNGQPMPNHRMADDAEDTGQKGFNYRTEPLWARNGVGTSGADFNELNQVDYTDTLSSYKNSAACLQGKLPCDPETPIFEAPAGTNVRFRVLHPGGHSRQHAFVLHGHNWDYQPWIENSTKLWDGLGDVKDKPLTARVGAIGGIGPSRHLNILTKAGGEFAVPGDYLFRVQEQFQFQGGLWGIFRVQ